MGKRRRDTSADAAVPCDVVPILGTLSDESDVNKAMSKLVAIAMPDPDLEAVESALRSMLSRVASDQVCVWQSV